MPPEDISVGLLPQPVSRPGLSRAFFAHFAADPIWNMAVDDTLLALANSPGACSVRLYTWRPGAITIGANQSVGTALDVERLGGTPVVRRITGGRALYHDESELTYAIAANMTHPAHPAFALHHGGRETWMAERLREFARVLGIDAHWVRQSTDTDRHVLKGQKLACFASVARYELVSQGRKVVASAERRSHCAFLRHGAIKLCGVLTHPALRGVDSGDSPALQPVTADCFARAARLFRAVWEDALGFDLGEPDTGATLKLASFEQTHDRLLADPLSVRYPD